MFFYQHSWPLEQQLGPVSAAPSFCNVCSMSLLRKLNITFSVKEICFFFFLGVGGFYFFTFYFFPFIFISWRLITLQSCIFAIHWHESAMDLHVFPIPIPPPASLPIPSLWVIPVHHPWAPVSCIQPGLVICFTLDSILVSMLLSQNIPPSPSPTESKSLFCTSVSLFLFCI